MNIFRLHEGYAASSSLLHDRHVVKMVLETTQMLCTALHQRDDLMLRLEQEQILCRFDLYRPTHESHPMQRWVTERTSNFIWTTNLGMALCDEYRARFRRTHKCESLILPMYSQLAPILRATMGDDYNPTEMPRCMPARYQVGSVVESYRLYYAHEKLTQEHVRFTNSDASRSFWLNQVENELDLPSELMRKLANRMRVGLESPDSDIARFHDDWGSVRSMTRPKAAPPKPNPLLRNNPSIVSLGKIAIR